MYVPADLNDFDDLIYRTGRVARAEVLLQYANEQLFFELVGRESRAVNALSSRSHSAIIAANARMMATSDFDHELRRIAAALFKRARKAILLRDQVVHGAFVLMEQKGTLVRVNSERDGQFHWTNEHFDDAHTALRRSRQSTGALEEIVGGKRTRDTSLRFIADDMFALYGNNTAMASTPEGRRTDPETVPV
jgi:hypothetical protein